MWPASNRQDPPGVLFSLCQQTLSRQLALVDQRGGYEVLGHREVFCRFGDSILIRAALVSEMVELAPGAQKLLGE